MAHSIPRRTASNLQSANQPPIVLARLPRVGEQSRAAATLQTTSRSAPSTASFSVTHPPTAQPPAPLAPEAMPQLELRDQIAQRTQLHIANTPRDEPVPARTKHFVDRQHRAAQEPPPPEPRIHQPSLAKDTASKPTAGIGEKVFQLHSQLAPHAGLIVALALIASAGLLYWMIVGPGQVPLPHYDNQGREFGQEGYGANYHYPPEFAAQSSAVTPSLTAPSPITPSATAEPADLNDSWKLMELPQTKQAALPKVIVSPQPAEFEPKMPEPTAIESEGPKLLQLPPTEDRVRESLPFPTTNHREGLNFSTLSQPTAKVAGRPSASPLR